MRKKQLTVDEAKEARTLLNYPGGLELHIGVRPSLLQTVLCYIIF